MVYCRKLVTSSFGSKYFIQDMGVVWGKTILKATNSASVPEKKKKKKKKPFM